MNLASNPWSFVPADVAPHAITASPGGLSQTANGVIAITLTGVPSFTWAAGQEYWIAGAGVTGYNGLWEAVTVPTTSTMTAIPSRRHPALASSATSMVNSGNGTMQPGPQYNSNVRLEDLNWMNVSAAGNSLLVQDQNGNDIWRSTSIAAGQWNRGKPLWVNGIWVFTLQDGELLLTVN